MQKIIWFVWDLLYIHRQGQVHNAARGLKLEKLEKSFDRIKIWKFLNLRYFINRKIAERANHRTTKKIYSMKAFWKFVIFTNLELKSTNNFLNENQHAYVNITNLFFKCI
jgi:hypothetical protein